MHVVKLAASLLVLLALVLGAAPARAETVNCTAITVPAVITLQGIYCFTGHQQTSISSGFAIDIQANNVILDLNGFKLGGLAAGPGTTAFGIHAVNRQNITIKNGTVRGFLHGIVLGDITSAPLDQGHVVEDIRADQNTFAGINVQGTGHIVRNNVVVTTGGTTVGNPNAIGILVQGTGSRVINNDVINTVAQAGGTAWGILLGIAPGSVSGGFVVNNRISVADRGVEFVAGTGSTGKYRDNLTFGVTTPYTGGTDAGNNN